MEKKFIDYYKEWMETDLPKAGLCNSLPSNLYKSKAFNLVKPTVKDLAKLGEKGYSSLFWGSDINLYSPFYQRYSRFNELRQTLILLAAAINDEL